ncbi:MAG TPA: hypothetical protein PKB02_10610 [Anaerohalosphaeraceae bacterium]|nr:hypothetical protein [Anaerohalosphaeraceae bacterium]
MSKKTSEKLGNNQTSQKPLFDKFVPGKTRCRYCEAALRVRGTTTVRMPDGGVMISRSVRCQGPKSHGYELKEVFLDKSAAPISPEEMAPKESKVYDVTGLGSIHRIPIDQFVINQTKCFYCDSLVRVRYKDSERLPDGRVKVSRQVMCKGPRGHQFIYEEIVGDIRKDKPEGDCQSTPSAAEVRHPNKPATPRKAKK